MTKPSAFSALFALLLLTAACGSDPTATPVPTATPTAAMDADHESIEAGEALYKANGCTACHGQEAEGGIGPALAGHTREQVLKQVRTPVGGVMPAFSIEAISEAQLEQIAAFIVSLEGTNMHHDDEGMMMDATPEAPTDADQMH